VSFSRALGLAHEAGIKMSVMSSLEGMASLAGALEDAVRAARLWGAVETARKVGRIALSPIERAVHEPYLASARSRLGGATWEEVLASGRAMSLDEAAAYALSERAERSASTIRQEPSTHAASIGDLSPREREVASLIARGLTNRQISIELSISERTAANHVARILKKLDLHSRAQIAGRVNEA
jgi:DNA-binding NarL/FixJ family response regulator